MIEQYKEKIRIILENRLEFNQNHNDEIQIVHNWLSCEWQLSNISTEEFCFLKDFIDEISEEMIKQL